MALVLLMPANSSRPSVPKCSTSSKPSRIGPKRADGIAAGWAEQRAIREIMIFLHAHGVGTSRAVRSYQDIWRRCDPGDFGSPYRLARDIRGIGFKTADAVAMKLGIEKTAMIQARPGSRLP